METARETTGPSSVGTMYTDRAEGKAIGGKKSTAERLTAPETLTMPMTRLGRQTRRDKINVTALKEVRP